MNLRPSARRSGARTAVLAAAFVTLLTSTAIAHAAASLEEAVTTMAKSLASSRNDPAQEPIRIAVTAFLQSDGKITQFTNLVMVALTGRVVEFGKGTFRVIERAQLEAAYSEIEIGDRPIFDEQTAKEVGKFLNVEALIVGEIIPLTDVIRLDARLISVETLETLAQSSERVPLTPTLQKQLDAPARLTRAGMDDGDVEDARNGIWQGSATCGDLNFGVAVSLVVGADDRLSAMQTYYPLDDVENAMQSGALAMRGSIDSTTGEFELIPDDWLYRPPGHGAVGFGGVLDITRERIEAEYKREGCEELTLNKMR